MKATFTGLGATDPDGMAPFSSDEERDAYYLRADVRRALRLQLSLLPTDQRDQIERDEA